MRTREVLVRIPALEESTLHYWRQRGYIKCSRKRVGKREISDYSEGELRKIELMYQYVREGYKPSQARIRAEQRLAKKSSLVYGSPISVNEGDAGPGEDIAKSLALVRDTLNDPSIRKEDRAQIARQIMFLVKWLGHRLRQ